MQSLYKSVEAFDQSNMSSAVQMSGDIHTHRFTPSVELFAQNPTPDDDDDTPEDLPSYSKPNRESGDRPTTCDEYNYTILYP